MIKRLPSKIPLLVFVFFLAFNCGAFAQLPVITYSSPRSYTINTAITPLTPTNNGTPVAAYGEVTTFAGAGNGVSGAADGLRSAASFKSPQGLVVDVSNNLFLADHGNDDIREITPNGAVITFAGSGNANYHDGLGTGASFANPNNIAIDAVGNFYVSDQSNQQIRKMTSVGQVTSFAGNGSIGSANGTRFIATFHNPYGLVFDSSGNLFVADCDNNEIREITSNGTVSTFAGSTTSGSTDATGTAASFKSPRGLAIDQFNNIYVADYGNNEIRKITPAGVVTTVAGNVAPGSVDQSGTLARFNGPWDITIDAQGNLYIADTNNSTIREITQAGFVVSTLSGTAGSPGHRDGSIGTQYNNPDGITMDHLGNLYVSESGNQDIRLIRLTVYSIDKPLPTGLVFDTKTGTISGTPATTSAATDYTITAYNSIGSSTAVVNIAVNPATPTVAAPIISYSTPQTYVVNSQITTLMPTNSGGAVPPAVYGQVTTFAGNGVAGYKDDIGTAARFNAPASIAMDAAGNFYVPEYNNKVVRKITPDGVVSTIAGTYNQAGSTDGPALSATFTGPNSVAFNSLGEIFVADYMGNTIRKISTLGVVTTFAGSSTPGYFDSLVGTSALFNQPYGLAIDANDNIYVADLKNNAIRKITSGGVVSTLAGDGTRGSVDKPPGSAAEFYSPGFLTTDASGNVYVSDGGNNSIRKIATDGTVTTLAGNFSGSPSLLNTGVPGGLRIDNAGNIYFASISKNAILELTAGNTLKTIAGDGTAGARDGSWLSAEFNQPQDIAIDKDGNFYVPDKNNNVIRKINETGYTIDQALPPGLTFDPTTGYISGTPTAVWPNTPYTITAYNASGSSVTHLSIQVISNLLPSIITFPNQTGNNIDSNDNLNLGTTSTNTQTPITYTSSDQTVAVITNNGTVIHVVGPGVVTITASQSANNIYSAGSASEPVTIIENQVITFPAIVAKTTCDLDFSANATSNANVIPLMYVSTNPLVATVSSSGLIHIVGVGTTTITVSQAGSSIYNAATSRSQTLNVITPLIPVVAITANNAGICAGTPITFSATVTNGGASPTYQWSLNGTTVGTNSPSYVGSNISVSDIIKCIVVNNDYLCHTTGSASVSNVAPTPNVTPSISIQSSGTTICPNVAVTFTATVTNGGSNPTFQWQVNGINTGNNSSQFTPANLANGDKVSCILNTNGTGCFTASTATSNVVTVTVTALPAIPSITITPSANNVYAGNPVTFIATVNNNGASPNYQWQVNGANAGTNVATFTSSSLFNGDKVTCILTLPGSCLVPVTSLPVVMTILAPPTVKVNNAFTPNGDGVNDLWDIPDLAFYPNCMVNVYNRYGSSVYYSKGYRKSWDGLFDGKPLPVATYYYVIDLGNNSGKLSGYVTIIR